MKLRIKSAVGLLNPRRALSAFGGKTTERIHHFRKKASLFCKHYSVSIGHIVYYCSQILNLRHFSAIQSSKPSFQQTILFRYYCMYRRFRHAEILGRLPHCRVMIDDIIGNRHCSFLDIILQKNTP